MSTEKTYHYTYRITNTRLNKHYYGKRSSKILPKEDLGIKYFSSSKDKDFIKDQKSNPEDYKYKVIYIFDTPEKAINLEIKLHNKFDVGVNIDFYNKAKQTSSKFTTNGLSGENNPMYGRRHTKSAKDIISQARKSRIYTEAQRKALSKRFSGEGNINYGKTHSEETKKKISASLVGKNHPQSKLANIYCYTTNELIAENIVIKEWSRDNNLDHSSLAKTARSDKTKPSSKTNRRHYKQLYAVYI